MDAVLEIAHKHRCSGRRLLTRPSVRDAMEKGVGTLGKLALLSFFPSKKPGGGAGDGGLIKQTIRRWHSRPVGTSRPRQRGAKENMVRTVGDQQQN